MQEEKKDSPSLEREVIVAVTILYLFIMGAVLAIHYLQPAGRQTTTSSPSPSHDHFSGADVPDAGKKRGSTDHAR